MKRTNWNKIKRKQLQSRKLKAERETKGENKSKNRSIKKETMLM